LELQILREENYKQISPETNPEILNYSEEEILKNFREFPNASTAQKLIYLKHLTEMLKVVGMSALENLKEIFLIVSVIIANN
jgi:hypothetical protein